ncbi:zinc finger-containing protein ZPR1 [Ascoidea rubescens DSM 1968]|uniref:Zf-ZPR1-domain-containing protein n=1 Tax=Ascoidea rubescens DSM 1968 TaxID=1344418 RepID=A0A1D2V8L1_9ASCO|nr:zf-ZPR1-domain-containing protein [Ascoidea rubescens DSM 1968]ODV57847.1 zf-ZPR1-domain-containing protein [Ascoidea rubescens DSM 1968]
MASEEKENYFKPVSEVVESTEVYNDGIKKTDAHDSAGNYIQEIQSLCVNCEENGVTRILLTNIPYFRDVILMSFECPHCGFKNSEIQPATEIQENGSKYVFRIENKKDFNRQIVKSETATCKFKELEIEIPPKRGQLTNLEGLLREMVDDLQSGQPVRKYNEPELFNKIEGFINKVNDAIDCKEGILPITFTMSDPSGNSWIEFVPNEAAHKWSLTKFKRTPEQNVFLGLITQDKMEENKKLAKEREENETKFAKPISKGFISEETEIENFENEVQTFYATCSSCYKPCETHMKMVNIPHFKEVIIMSTVCDHCGYRSNEVKTGGAIPEMGRRITLKVDDPEDLKRDLLKSETCQLVIPEINLDLTPGTLGGRFTTLEGILREVYEELHSKVFTETSDSMESESKHSWQAFFEKLQKATDGKMVFTVIMEDPLAASYIQNVYAPDDDPNMVVEDYERTEDQNETLGLNDMQT